MDGARIKEKRERLHLSQQELAEKAGISLHTVFRAEKGKNIQNKNLEAIATALETSAAYFMEKTYNSESSENPSSLNIFSGENNVLQEISTGDNGTNAISGNTITTKPTPQSQNNDIKSDGQNIIFERGEGPGKVRMVLPATPETYAFLREQGEIGHWIFPQPPLAT
jgi:transcriptional regulator with XRE-family HTH domain